MENLFNVTWLVPAVQGIILILQAFVLASQNHNKN